ncbi:MAG: NADP-dependent oxidoreductase [Alphaproteobacteria bacterium]|jgi:NADPH-dependent curcumin reductase CurA|nr:NADP-dependent oxidoreductase [Alphaproteobacteria bacterium]
MTDNQQILLAARPMGMPKATDWTLQTVPVQEPGEGEVLVRVLYLSLDPAMRGWMNDVRSYIKPVGLGEVMRAGGVGEVVASKAEGFKPGDHVSGTLNVQQYALARAKDLVRLDLGLAPLTNYLSVLGMPGLTAYFGLLDVGQPKAGETVVVSGAAGAVGQVVGQIAKLKGCRVVGIAGGADKCRWVVDDLGFDAAIDYKAEPVGKALRQHCPKGIDVYFDNVGGDILDAALGALAFRGRIVICGAISQYNATAEVKGPSKYLSLLVNRARMEGMVIFDYVDRFPEAVREMAGWLAQGKLKTREHIVEGGIPAFPETLNMLFTGENFGKLVLKV